MNDHAIYVHFPFCKSRCMYCDFVSNTVSPLPVSETTQQLIAELQARKEYGHISTPPLSIYLGGGTPSLWPADALARLLSACLNGASSENIEITVELNPGDVDERWIQSVMAAGANRFSLGVQAMNDDRLKWLGRRHTVAHVNAAIHRLRNAGVDNISVDFIYATANLTSKQMGEELNALCALEPDHISAYELTIAEGTPLAEMALSEIDNETRAFLWHSMGDHLARNGFTRYEVSNYAKNNNRSRHNSHYWQGGTYLGIGSGAHGFLVQDGIRHRYSNGATLNSWLTGTISANRFAKEMYIGDGFAEQLSDTDFARELIMLGLRCTNGISARQLAPLIQNNQSFQNQLTELQNEGWVFERNNRYVPTENAMLLADELALRFF